MSKRVCQYLSASDANNQPQAPVDYPSFENQCLAVDMPEILPLATQATFCLSGAYGGCTRFAAQPTPSGAQPAFAAAASKSSQDTLFAPLPETLAEDGDPVDDLPSPRRRWAWMGATLIFMSVVLCGGSFAAYTGWQMVSERALAARPGRVEVLANAPPPAQPAFQVVTATSTPGITPPPTNPAVANGQQPLVAVANNFPQAVTPTPIVVGGQINSTQTLSLSVTVSAPADTTVDTAQPISAQPPPNIDLPTPGLDLNMEIPTRRPTPLFDLPTSTPVDLALTMTPTATVVLGPPLIVFAPVKNALVHGECTLVRWHVENVRSVYYENQGVNGDGEHEECMHDQNQILTLLVQLGDGTNKTYTTTVAYVPPTITPTPTPTFTPEKEVEPTPTWTSVVPTETPTPVPSYSVSLQIFGENHHSCEAGNTCEFELLVTNAGNVRDTLTVSFIESADWPALLCAESGDCSGGSLTVREVDTNGAKLVKVKINVPSDITAQNATYTLQATSNGSNGVAASDTVSVELEVP